MIKALEENMFENLPNFRVGRWIFLKAQKAWNIKETMDKQVSIKTWSFCSSEDTTRKMKKQSTNWEKKIIADIWQSIHNI